LNSIILGPDDISYGQIDSIVYPRNTKTEYVDGDLEILIYYGEKINEFLNYFETFFGFGSVKHINFIEFLVNQHKVDPPIALVVKNFIYNYYFIPSDKQQFKVLDVTAKGSIERKMKGIAPSLDKSNGSHKNEVELDFDENIINIDSSGNIYYIQPLFDQGLVDCFLFSVDFLAKMFLLLMYLFVFWCICVVPIYQSFCIWRWYFKTKKAEKKQLKEKIKTKS